MFRPTCLQSSVQLFQTCCFCCCRQLSSVATIARSSSCCINLGLIPNSSRQPHANVSPSYSSHFTRACQFIVFTIITHHRSLLRHSIPAARKTHLSTCIRTHPSDCNVTLFYIFYDRDRPILCHQCYDLRLG